MNFLKYVILGYHSNKLHKHELCIRPRTSERSFVSEHYVCSLSTDNILVCICEVYLLFVMECDLAYENFSSFLLSLLPFQNTHIKDAHIDQFSNK